MISCKSPFEVIFSYKCQEKQQSRSHRFHTRHHLYSIHQHRLQKTELRLGLHDGNWNSESSQCSLFKKLCGKTTIQQGLDNSLGQGTLERWHNFLASRSLGSDSNRWDEWTRFNFRIIFDPSKMDKWRHERYLQYRKRCQKL